MVHFEDQGMFPKVHQLEDFGGFRKVPSQNTYGVRVKETCEEKTIKEILG